MLSINVIKKSCDAQQMLHVVELEFCQCCMRDRTTSERTFSPSQALAYDAEQVHRQHPATHVSHLSPVFPQTDDAVTVLARQTRAVPEKTSM